MLATRACQSSQEIKAEGVLGVAECEDSLQILLPPYPAVLATESSGEEGVVSTSTASPPPDPTPTPRAFSLPQSLSCTLGAN